MDTLPRAPLRLLMRLRADGVDVYDGWSIDRVIAANIPAPRPDPPDTRTLAQFAADEKQTRHFADHPPPVSAESQRVADESFARMLRGPGR